MKISKAVADDIDLLCETLGLSSRNAVLLRGVDVLKALIEGKKVTIRTIVVEPKEQETP